MNEYWVNYWTRLGVYKGTKLVPESTIPMLRAMGYRVVVIDSRAPIGL